jgi:DNA-binding transcriptional LysR family regulator
MNITLKQIRAFRALAELGSFTRAAERLHVTQSSLSVLIRELEAELELRLFHRTTRNVELTDAGREFLPFVTKALADLEHAVLNTRELAARERGRVTIATPPIAAAVLLPPAIAGFRARYPGMSVVLQDLPPEQVVSHVRSGLADCGIGPFDNAVGTDLQRAPLVSSSLMVICPPTHPLAGKARVTWNDVPNYALIAIASVRRDLDRKLPLGRSIRPTYEVVQMVTAIGMVGAGLGIAIVPSWMEPMTRLYDIVMRPVTGPTISREISVLTRRDYMLSPAAESFVAHMKKHLKLLASCKKIGA